jgi:superoxide reductase
MKRRNFLAAVGLGAGTVFTGSVGPVAAAERVKEARSQVYKCQKCGTIVEILVPGKSSTLVHCGEPMTLLEEQVAEAAKNKHVPVITKVDGGFKVAVGSTPHPMTESHWIEWIDLIADGKAYRQFLKPGDKPEAVFMLDATEVSAREHCNLHGLWKDK